MEGVSVKCRRTSSASGSSSPAAEVRELQVLAERYPQEREEILVEAVGV
jgi:hypothetical protein